MSDTPREPDPDDAPTSRFPTTEPESGERAAAAGEAGPPATDASAAEPASSAAEPASSAAEPALGTSARAGDADDWVGPAGRRSPGRARRRAAEGGTGGAVTAGAEAEAGLGGTPSNESLPDQGDGGSGTRRRRIRLGPVADGPLDERQRRRRRWFLIGIAVAAAIVVVALCAGALSIVSAVDGARDRAADAREARALRETDCLDLERRLNRLIPPGATSGPAARATAIRDENAALRLYLDQLDSQRDQDAWRQLLDARSVFADALDRQAKSRTPAFYVAPRTSDGLAVTDQLARWLPAPCAGSVRRLAAPEL
ncbi:hypothetical protein [Actinoplanes sp. NPDC026619]|uniref:hypothetical protein n=1 Tax=Actinoplanes sp. NPDC026619 TaxID=3155798 RepID=UPI0033D6C266